MTNCSTQTRKISSGWQDKLALENIIVKNKTDRYISLYNRSRVLNQAINNTLAQRQSRETSVNVVHWAANDDPSRKTPPINERDVTLAKKRWIFAVWNKTVDFSIN